MNSRIAVIVLNWNGREDTAECLSSVLKDEYRNFSAIVVDNGSIDGSVQAIRQAFPEVVVLETGKNLGYAGGNNVGIRWALDNGFDGIFLLNNDTTIEPGCLGALASAHRRSQGKVIYGAKIYYFGSDRKLWFAGGRWNADTLAFEHVGIGEQDSEDYSKERSYDYMTGCAIYASAEVFRRVGLLDETFFLTYEETDWCYRAREQGYECRLLPEAKVWHKVSASFGGAESPLVRYFMVRNKLLWAKRHLAFKERLAIHREVLQTGLRILFPKVLFRRSAGGMVPRLDWAVETWRKDQKRSLSDPHNRSTLMAIRDYYLGRFGDCPPEVRDVASQASGAARP